MIPKTPKLIEFRIGIKVIIKERDFYGSTYQLCSDHIKLSSGVFPSVSLRGKLELSECTQTIINHNKPLPVCLFKLR